MKNYASALPVTVLMATTLVFLLAASGSSAGTGMSLEHAIATGECDPGDMPCLEALMAAGGDDSSSDDKSSRDDDSSSDDGSSDDKGSKDDDSQSDDESSDDKGSKDDDSRSDDESSDDDSKDDDGKSDDESSDDESSDDTGGSLPSMSISGSQVTEFNNVTVVQASATISLSAPSTETVSVSWATEDGTALAGGDYLAASGQVEFLPGDQFVVIELSILGDDAVEPTESFFVRLSSPMGASIAVSAAEVIILDDDIDEE